VPGRSLDAKEIDDHMEIPSSVSPKYSSIAATAWVDTRIGPVFVEAGLRGLRKVVLPAAGVDILRNLPAGEQALFAPIDAKSTLARLGIVASIVDAASMRLADECSAGPNTTCQEEDTSQGQASPDEIVSTVSRDIRLFFEGQLEPERLRFDFPLELPGRSEFSRKVMLGMTRIPPGRVSTYGELAALSGHAKSARAVGAVVGANPLPLVVPCHRVIGAGGRLTGYGGGLPLKVALLAMEQMILGGSDLIN
jgi:methylated-DNA-[protein]-cysteine S-methyltransferase